MQTFNSLADLLWQKRSKPSNRLFTSLFLSFFTTISLFAQENTSNRVLDPDIRTVQINAGTIYPMVPLNGGIIRLNFDRIGGEIRSYVYTIVHCNSDWQPSDLQDNEYIDGYTEDRIININSSVSTLLPYTTYYVQLPNANMAWTVSGNYILKVFDEDNDNELVMVRRFMVMENQWLVEAKMSTISNAGKIFSHQEIDFSVSHDRFAVRDPQREVTAFIYQNMRWDRVIGPVNPRPFSAIGNTMNFDFQDSIVFPGGKEWRFFDMRTFDYRGNNIDKMERNRDTWQVYLKQESDRYESHGYALTSDINGRYEIANKTPGQSFEQTEYANVLFTLKRNAPFEEREVYVYGELTDWRLLSEFKMEYDEPSHTYFCNPLLKQGYYNYIYNVIDENTGKPAADDDMEGDWHETGNLYSIFVYYRPFGSRYDRLMTVGGIDSRTNKK